MNIYTNRVSGKSYSNFSPSQSSEIDNCPTKYGLNRVLGYRSRKRGAKMEMGHALEAAVRTWRQAAGTSLLDSFRSEWARWESKDLDYPKEESWATFLAAGLEVLKVLRASWPSLGIKEPTFYTWDNRPTDMELFEDTKLQTVPDVIDWPDEHPRLGGGRRVIDIKTSPTPFHDKPDGIAAMDEQLRSYARAYEAWRVAFLVLVYRSGRPKKNYTVTALEECKDSSYRVIVKPGDTGKVEESVEKTTASPMVDWGKGVHARMPIEHLSTARVQFIEARVTPEQAEATLLRHRARATDAASAHSKFIHIMEPIEARKSSMTNSEYELATFSALLRAYPQQPGMRFPNDKCGWCEMLGLCLGRKDLVEERLVRSGEEWAEKL